MGWFFSLSAEFGSNKTDAENFALYFDKTTFVLSNQQKFFCSVPGGFLKQGGKEANLWCMVCPTKINGEDIDIYKDKQQMRELVPLLYQHLRSAPLFRFALVGIEVDKCITYEELISDNLILQKPEKFSGLVVSQEIWRKLGSPNSFVSFREGYFWIPYSLTYLLE